VEHLKKAWIHLLLIQLRNNQSIHWKATICWWPLRLEGWCVSLVLIHQITPCQLFHSGRHKAMITISRTKWSTCKYQRQNLKIAYQEKQLKLWKQCNRLYKDHILEQILNILTECSKKQTISSGWLPASLHLSS